MVKGFPAREEIHGSSPVARRRRGGVVQCQHNVIIDVRHQVQLLIASLCKLLLLLLLRET